MITYNFNETDYTLIPSASINLVYGGDYLSIDIGVDFKFPNSGAYSILLSKTSFTYNVEEWVVIGD